LQGMVDDMRIELEHTTNELRDNEIQVGQAYNRLQKRQLALMGNLETLVTSATMNSDVHANLRLTVMGQAQ